MLFPKIHVMNCIQPQAESSQHFVLKIGPLSSPTSLHDLSIKFRHIIQNTTCTCRSNYSASTLSWHVEKREQLGHFT